MAWAGTPRTRAPPKTPNPNPSPSPEERPFLARPGRAGHTWLDRLIFQDRSVSSYLTRQSHWEVAAPPIFALPRPLPEGTIKGTAGTGFLRVVPQTSMHHAAHLA